MDPVSAYRTVALRRVADLEEGRLDAVEASERIWRMLRLAFVASAMYRHPSHDGSLRPELRKPLEDALIYAATRLEDLVLEAKSDRWPDRLEDRVSELFDLPRLLFSEPPDRAVKR
jgi:hypothetical protein